MVNVTERMPDSVVIKVTPPDDNGGMPISGYRVHYNDGTYDYNTGAPAPRVLLMTLITMPLLLLLLRVAVPPGSAFTHCTRPVSLSVCPSVTRSSGL